MNEIRFYPQGDGRFIPEVPLSPADCVRHGGHCWYDEQRFMQGNGVQMVGQRCKHCPATRSGVSRDPYEWTYPDGQP